MSDKSKNLEVKKEELNTPQERTRDCRCFIPNTDIYETNDDIHVVTDIPGADEKNVEVTLEKNILTITARVEPELPDGYSLLYAEYSVGDYERSFTVSEMIDRDHIDASVKNGVLHLRLPKAGPAKTQKISVKAL
jgi:HSP20 family protein